MTIKLEGTRDEIREVLNGYGPGDIDRGRFMNLENPDEKPALPEGWEGFLDEHPEGSDRGGYVPTVSGPAGQFFYSEHDGEWFEA